MQALGDWVVLQPVQKIEAGKIIIPEDMKRKEDADFALVISVSQNEEELKEGDIVLLLLGSCLQMPEIDDQHFITCRRDRVICITERAD